MGRVLVDVGLVNLFQNIRNRPLTALVIIAKMTPEFSRLCASTILVALNRPTPQPEAIMDPLSCEDRKISGL